MARRRSSRSTRARGGSGGGFGTLVAAMVALALGVAGGYAWRSVAPLPLATPWGGDQVFADSKPLPAITTTSNTPPRPAPPTAAENAEIARLRAEIDRLRQAQSQTAQDVAEMQIKSVLGEE